MSDNQNLHSEREMTFPIELLELSKETYSNLPDIDTNNLTGRSSIETTSDGKTKFTYVYVEKDSKDPTITYDEFEKIQILKQEGAIHIPTPASIKEKFGLEPIITASFANETILPTDKVIYALLLTFDPEKPDQLGIDQYNGIKGHGVGSEVLGKNIPELAKRLQIRFLTASVNFRNKEFFDKLGYVSAKFLDSQLVEECFGEIGFDLDTYKVFFINPSDKEKFIN